MASPRVFISSTYYDLQHVRNDIKSFLTSIGYEPVMHDVGNVTYSQDVSIEKSCYNELSSCDIVICIIGGKFGSESKEGSSITMEELNSAIRGRKKIFVYIQENVYSENFTYLANKDNNFKPYHVDDIRIHQYISELKNKVRNHPIVSFNSATDIVNNLRQQFAGLFQYLLGREATLTESETFNDIKNTSEEIKRLVNDFRNETESLFGRFNGTRLMLLGPIKYLLNLLEVSSYQVYIPTIDALKSYLFDIGYQDITGDDVEAGYIFIKKDVGTEKKISFSSELVDKDGNIIENRMLRFLEAKILFEVKEVDEGDDIPF